MTPEERAELDRAKAVTALGNSPMRGAEDSLIDVDPIEARKIRAYEANTASTERLASLMPPADSEWWKPKPAIREKMWAAVAVAFCTIAIAVAGWVAARLSPVAPAEPRTVIVERIVETPATRVVDAGTSTP